MGNENFLRTVYLRVYNYFACKPVRRIFFFALVATVFFALLTWITSESILGMLLIVSVIVTLAASSVDSWQNRREFLAGIEIYRQQQYAKIAAASAHKTTDQIQPPFSTAELNWIKQKKREFSYYIAIKVVLIIFCVMFLLKAI